MGSIKNVNIDLEKLEQDKKKNFEDRLKFIDFWTEYMKKHKEESWSKQQKALIDSQVKH